MEHLSSSYSLRKARQRTGRDGAPPGRIPGGASDFAAKFADDIERLKKPQLLELLKHPESKWHQRGCPQGLLEIKVMPSSIKVFLINKNGKQCVFQRFTR